MRHNATRLIIWGQKWFLIVASPSSTSHPSQQLCPPRYWNLKYATARAVWGESRLGVIYIHVTFTFTTADTVCLSVSPLSTALVNSKSALDRSLTLLLQQRSRKIYLLSANKCQQRRKTNKKEWQEEKKTLKQTKHQTKSQFVYKHTIHVTKAAGCVVFDRY